MEAWTSQPNCLPSQHPPTSQTRRKNLMAPTLFVTYARFIINFLMLADRFAASSLDKTVEFDCQDDEDAENTDQPKKSKKFSVREMIDNKNSPESARTIWLEENDIEYVFEAYSTFTMDRIHTSRKVETIKVRAIYQTISCMSKNYFISRIVFETYDREDEPILKTKYIYSNIESGDAIGEGSAIFDFEDVDFPRIISNLIAEAFADSEDDEESEEGEEGEEEEEVEEDDEDAEEEED